MNSSPRSLLCKMFSRQFARGKTTMQCLPLIVSPVAASLVAILTGCHLSRTPSPALSMAAVALSAGSLLMVQSVISLGAKCARRNRCKSR